MSSTVTLAECSHERLTMTYDPILERYYVDENTHYTEATVYNVCKDCGEEVTYISPMGYSSHEYTNGVCSCGAVEPSSGSSDKEDFEEEQHTHSWEEVDRESVYEYYSDKYHSEESVIVYYECECGAEKEKTKAGDGSKKRHRFNSWGVCKDCGYEEETEECEHENLSFEYDPLYSYEIVDETYHHTYVRLYYECDDCGESIQKVQDSGNSKHCFENGKCAQCGYIGNVSTATPEPIMRPTVRPTIEVAETIKATPIPTVQPTAPPHVCVTGVPSHWYGVYKYYDELRHTRHHVTTTYCSECGKELNKTNELEYVAHVFESGKCEKCGWKCEHINIQEVISDDILGYIEVGKEYHLSQHLVKEICNVCAQTFESKIVSRETKKHVFSNGYCKYCGYEEPLFLPDELPTGQYVNEELDSRLDYFIENIQGRGAQNILTRLIAEIETMENSSKSSQAYKNAKENALELMYQLKNSYEYQCNARIDDAYNPYKSFMSFIDQFGALKAIGIYSDIESDPGFCKMVDAALNSYEITSETFKPALAYIETFNKTFTYEIVGVIDLGLIAGTATEIAINGVTYSSAAKVDPAKGYDSWSKMKKEIGSAGDGNEWHHIVEQSQQQKSVFSSQLVNNPDNVVSIPSDVHRKITGHYNSKAFSHTKGLTVRDWLAGQSFEAQYKYGLKLLKRFLK